jgi:hypothetical protein
MSDDKPDNKEEPKIRFGGEWLPAHEVWEKMETATVVADAIEHFNVHFPDLSSEQTRQVVEIVRQRLKDIELLMPRHDGGGPLDLEPIAADLLNALSPEETLDTLRDKHGISMDLQQLVQLAGVELYSEALAREAREFEANRVLPEQAAQIWNEAGRPAPGGGLWTGRKIRELVDR